MDAVEQDREVEPYDQERLGRIRSRVFEVVSEEFC